MRSATEAVELSLLLRGETFCIPNLRTIFQHWPYAKNLHLEPLRQELDGILERYSQIWKETLVCFIDKER